MTRGQLFSKVLKQRRVLKPVAQAARRLGGGQWTFLRHCRGTLWSWQGPGSGNPSNSDSLKHLLQSEQCADHTQLPGWEGAAGASLIAGICAVGLCWTLPSTHKKPFPGFPTLIWGARVAATWCFSFFFLCCCPRSLSLTSFLSLPC
jgi:hypothetical protein